MFYRLLFFLCFSISFAQDSLKLDLVNSSQFDNPCFIELSNIGDPLLFLIPFKKTKNLSLDHVSLQTRKLDYFSNINWADTDTIYSHVLYQGAYEEGGILETFLTRPVGKNIKLTFAYNNLSSLGVYANQKNQSSFLDLKIDYNNSNDPLSFYFLFASKNGIYNQNGGLNLYDINIDPNLMSTYLNSETMLKRRKIETYHRYELNSQFSIAHIFSFNSFKRNYVDMIPLSYHYSFKSFDILQGNVYVDSTFVKGMSNKVALSNKNLSFTIGYNSYRTNELPKSKLDNIDIVVSNTNDFVKKRNLSFMFHFCPLGYNKNNFIIDLSLIRNIERFYNTFNFNWMLKKPDIFHNLYGDNNNFSWESFDAIRQLDLNFNSFIPSRYFKISTNWIQYFNYIYFNNSFEPIQLKAHLSYFNLKIEKSIFLKHFSFNSMLCLQNSSHTTALSVPFILLDQSIKYNRIVFRDIRLATSFNFRIFSKYHIPSYFPLTDMFYQQADSRQGMIPITSMDISIYKKYFSFSLILDNVQSFFYEGNFFVKDYFLPPPILRTAINWQFLD